MASPKMVDIRQLNSQQLTEVSQRIETELQVLQNCHAELVSGMFTNSLRYDSALTHSYSMFNNI